MQFKVFMNINEIVGLELKNTVGYSNNFISSFKNI